MILTCIVLNGTRVPSLFSAVNLSRLPPRYQIEIKDDLLASSGIRGHDTGKLIITYMSPDYNGCYR